MDAQFWHQRWENEEIGFHQDQVNPFLVAHIKALKLLKGQRILVPLCGKTLDMTWLLSQGYQVVGVELSRAAVEQFFDELTMVPEIVCEGSLVHFRAHDIHIVVGDIFALSSNDIGNIDAIYDRAALVALPVDMRSRYTEHLIDLTKNAPQLLITFTYDQGLMAGPPFSLTDEEVTQRYQHRYHLASLSRSPVVGGLRGLSDITETVWHLAPLS